MMCAVEQAVNFLINNICTLHVFCLLTLTQEKGRTFPSWSRH